MTLISLKLWQNFIKRGCPVIALLSRGCLQSTGFWPGNPFIVEHISAYWLIVGYLISVSCIKHRRNDLQLFRPHSKLQWLTEKEKEQVILQQLDKDPSKGQGLSTIKNHITHDQGIQLLCDTISGIMHLHNADVFLAPEPGSTMYQLVFMRGGQVMAMTNSTR